MGIGYGGKTLRELLEYSEQIYQESGHYWGLRSLPLYEKDPLTWERLIYRLRAIVVLARELALHIAASPIARYIGETCTVLYTPEGDAIVHSTGILVHVHTMSEGIKWMIKMNYEENPGIKDGDHFVGNDPVLGNVHTTDVHTLTPIFYKDMLIGWVGTVIHQVDIGGNSPGHDIITATQRFEDGFYAEEELVYRDGKMFPHYYERSRRSVRTPLFYDLDDKSRIAANEIVKREVLRIVEEIGIDNYMELIREAIEKSRRDFISRVKERLIPGRYRSVAWNALNVIKEAWQPFAREDYLHAAPLEIIVNEDGTLFVDLKGNSPSGWHFSNGGISPLMGGFWVTMTQLLGYSELINEGFVRAVKFKVPPKSWVGDTNPIYSRSVPWWLLIPQMSGLHKMVAYGAFARGYVEEGSAGNTGTWDAPQGGGFTDGTTGDPPNIYFPIATFELSSQGLGANAVRDGLDWGHAMWNPEADMGDVEEWERNQRGFIYLARRIKKNIAGYGKFRGGASFEHVAVFYGAKDATLFNFGTSRVFLVSGINGGYPPASQYSLMAYNTNINEVIKEGKPYPLGDDPNQPEFEKYISGDIERLEYDTIYPREFRSNDIVYLKQSGGPGWGDPLDRPLDKCEDDLNMGIYSPEIMEKVFGVIAKYDEEKGRWIVDVEASKKKREEIRKIRMEKSIDFAQFYREERSILLEGKLVRPVAKYYMEQKEVSPDWFKEFLDFWRLPEDFSIHIQGKREYIRLMSDWHSLYLESYKKYLESKGYDLSKIRYLKYEDVGILR